MILSSQARAPPPECQQLSPTTYRALGASSTVRPSRSFASVPSLSSQQPASQLASLQTPHWSRRLPVSAAFFHHQRRSLLRSLRDARQRARAGLPRGQRAACPDPTCSGNLPPLDGRCLPPPLQLSGPQRRSLCPTLFGSHSVLPAANLSISEFPVRGGFRCSSRLHAERSSGSSLRWSCAPRAFRSSSRSRLAPTAGFFN